MTNIRQIAREAGVSVGTVSNVLNNRTNVTNETRKRVLEVIQRYNYHPSAVARSLSTRQTGTLGLVVSNISNPFFSSLAQGAMQTAQKRGCGLLVLGTSHDAHDLPDQVEVLTRQWVDGILIATEPLPERALKNLGSGDTPLVLMDYPQPMGGRVVGLISFDWKTAGTLATYHLLDLGHRRIGFLGGIPEHPSSKLREEGYLDALVAGGVDVDTTLMRSGDYLARSGYTSAMALMKLSAPPTAIVASNDLMALGALQAISELGLRVPNDISIVGMDDIPFAAFLAPPLTTVRAATHEAGRLGVEMLLDAPEADGAAQRVILPTELILRKSTQAVPGRS